MAAGEVIVRWTGRIVTANGLARLPARLRANSIQVDEDAYLVPPRLVAGDHVNHCCDRTPACAATTRGASTPVEGRRASRAG